MAPLIIIDKTYDLQALGAEAHAQVTSLQFVDAEIARANALLAVLQTAKGAYLRALQPYLDAQPTVHTTILQ